jgi:hypothetical protein
MDPLSHKAWGPMPHGIRDDQQSLGPGDYSSMLPTVRRRATAYAKEPKSYAQQESARHERIDLAMCGLVSVLNGRIFYS